MWSWISSPTEVIAHIFLLCTIASAGTDSDDFVHKTTTMPVLLSHVSRRWRAIALSTPRLWSFVVVGLTGSEATCSRFSHGRPSPSSQNSFQHDNTLRRLREFLTRSSNVPLRLHIDLRDENWTFQHPESSHLSDVDVKHLNHIFDILFAHICRWQDIEVLSDTWLPQYMFIKRCARFPIPPKLRHISLARCNAYFALEGSLFSPADLGEHTALFQSAGRSDDIVVPSLSDEERCALPHALQSVSLAGVHVDWGNCGTMFSGLTRLDLKYHAADVLPTLPELMKMLRSSERLESLSVVGWGHRSSASDVECLSDNGRRLPMPNLLDDCRRVHLPHLTEFAFGWVNASHASSLLSSVFTQERNPFPLLAELAIEDITNSLDPTSSRDSSLVLNTLSHILTLPSPIVQRGPIRHVILRHVLASSPSQMDFIAACSGRHGIDELTLQGTSENLLIALLRMVTTSADKGQESGDESHWHTCENSQKDQAAFFLDRLTIQEGNFCVDSSVLRVFLQVFPVPVDFASDGINADFEDGLFGEGEVPGVTCPFDDRTNWNPLDISILDTSSSSTSPHGALGCINAEDANTLTSKCNRERAADPTGNHKQCSHSFNFQSLPEIASNVEA